MNTHPCHLSLGYSFETAPDRSVFRLDDTRLEDITGHSVFMKLGDFACTIMCYCLGPLTSMRLGLAI